MANSAQARKRARQAERNRERNVAQRSHMRTMVKNTIKAVEAGDKEQATAAIKLAVPAIDRAGRKGLIHANKAARIKSRLIRLTKSL